MDEIVRAVSSDGFVKISAVCLRDTVEHARNIHRTSPVATAALGRTLCAASMLGELMKEDKASLTIRVNGGGPLGSVMAVSDCSGNVRGYVQNPDVELPLRADGKLDVGAAVGINGTMTVSRDIGLKEPYIGSSQLISGEIAEDLAAYLVESDQVGSACGLGVLVDTDCSVKAAGGFIVQLMPGAPDELINQLEANVRAVGAVTDVLSNADIDTLIFGVMAGLEPQILVRTPVEYRCYCSRERVLEALACTGAEALGEMAGSQENTEVSCQFCASVYRFSPDEMRSLLEKTVKSSAENT